MFLEDVKQSSNGERNEKIVYFFFVVVDIVIDDAGTYVCVIHNLRRLIFATEMSSKTFDVNGNLQQLLFLKC